MFARISCLIAVSLLVLHVALTPRRSPAADPPKKPVDDPMMVAYLQKETAKISEKVLDGAIHVKAWEEKRPRLQREYFDMLGLWPLPERTPLHAKVTGTIERSGVVIEKIHFQSKPGLYVTGNLYRPKPQASGASNGSDAKAEKLPTILYVCGHSGRGRDGNKTAFQDHGLWFATNGYLCFIIDTLQLGEVAGKHHGTYNLGRMWWQALGYTPAGVECWNGVRALDYLVSRPDVDAERLGVTGISGGGAATFWIAAADPRVKVAVPVSGMSDLETYVTDKVINGHCDCMMLVNTYHWEWTTIASLVAPRPLLFANSDNDKIFPMPGNRRIIDRLRQLYKMYEKPELVDEYISVGGHDYRPDLRIAIFKWFNKHLKNETGEVKDADFPKIAGKDLRVFPEDSDLPKDQINDRIDESFVARAEAKPPSGNWADWQSNMIKTLREKSFRALPEQLPPVRRFDREQVNKRVVEGIGTEEGIVVELTIPEGKDGKGELGTLLIRDVDTATDEEAWMGEHAGDGPVRILRVRPGRPGTPPNYLERAHALIGRTVDTGRVRDIAAVVHYLHDNDSQGRAWRVVGRKNAGVLAAYAALIEPAIAEVVVIDPPASHRNGPIFLNVLRVCDIPDALGLLAPRSLTLVGAKAKAFTRTEELYKAAGAGGKLIKK